MSGDAGRTGTGPCLAGGSQAKAYRKEHRLTYHERSDMKTLDLVPIDAHGAIPHKGGIAKCKELNEKKGNES